MCKIDRVIFQIGTRDVIDPMLGSGERTVKGPLLEGYKKDDNQKIRHVACPGGKVS